MWSRWAVITSTQDTSRPWIARARSAASRSTMLLGSFRSKSALTFAPAQPPPDPDAAAAALAVTTPAAAAVPLPAPSSA